MAKPLTLELSTDGSVGKPVFVSGSFNNWLPDLEAYRMKGVAPGRYRFTFPADSLPHFPLEYKYTLGSWERTELDEEGHARNNRRLPFTAGLVKDYVPHWSAPEAHPVDYFLPLHEVVSEAFPMP